MTLAPSPGSAGSRLPEKHRRFAAMVSFIAGFFPPREAISPTAYRCVTVGTLVFGFGAWGGRDLYRSGQPLFVASPTAIIEAIGRMYQQGTLFSDIWASSYVVLTGFTLAALVAVPLGVLMGSFAIVEAAIEPWVGFIRYLPVTALIPLFILIIGIGDVSRISVIFYGTFFQLVLLVADVSANVRKDLVESAYTLGIGRGAVLGKVLLPASLPGIVNNLRITLGWAWTYMVVAELLASNRGSRVSHPPVYARSAH